MFINFNMHVLWGNYPLRFSLMRSIFSPQKMTCKWALVFRGTLYFDVRFFRLAIPMILIRKPISSHHISSVPSVFPISNQPEVRRLGEGKIRR